MRRVIIESPYAARTAKGIARNLAYARACMRHSLSLGEAPFASHLLYTQEGVLCDEILQERDVGITAGLAWGKVADATIIYEDFGISCGMTKGIERAMEGSRKVEYRKLPREDMHIVLKRAEAA